MKQSLLATFKPQFCLCLIKASRQHNEEDCGAACLATIAKQYGRKFLVLTICGKLLVRGQLGNDNAGIAERCRKQFVLMLIPFVPLLSYLEQLDRAPLPAIIHWKGNHWVVLHGQKGKKYAIADPAVGIRYLTLSELQAGWE